VPIPPLPLPRKNAGLTGFGPRNPNAGKPAAPQTLNTSDEQQKFVVNEIKSYLKLQTGGARIPSPLSYKQELYYKVLDDLGYEVQRDGTIVRKSGASKSPKRSVR
jgi:hypothetical protein